jgi:hypothetical protein
MPPFEDRPTRGGPVNADDARFGGFAQLSWQVSNVSGQLKGVWIAIGGIGVAGLAAGGFLCAQLNGLGVSIGEMKGDARAMTSAFGDFKSDTKEDLKAIRADLASIRQAFGGAAPQLQKGDPLKKEGKLVPQRDFNGVVVVKGDH